MARSMFLLGACLLAVAPPVAANHVWDRFTNAGFAAQAASTDDIVNPMPPPLADDAFFQVGEEEAKVDLGAVHTSVVTPSITMAEPTITMAEPTITMAEPTITMAEPTATQPDIAALPPLMDVSFVSTPLAAIPTVDPRLASKPPATVAVSVSAMAGPDGGRACPPMNVDEEKVKAACANNPAEACTKCLPELSTQLVPQLLMADPPFESAAEIQQMAMECFPPQLPILAPLIPQLGSLLSCDIQAVMNNVDLSKLEQYRTPANAHLFEEAAGLFQEVNGAQVEGNGANDGSSTGGGVTDSQTPPRAPWYAGPYDQEESAAAPATISLLVLAAAALSALAL